jgi:serine/threonine protein kinase
VSTPERIGPWRILEPLGGGGNADVYLARDGDREVALKVLRTRKVGAEPYLRFRNEIDVVRQLQEDPGILPILDASLPEQPSRGNPAWVAMPVAVEIREALAAAELREVVTAVASISQTLERVAKAGIAHRDIKPDNLYVFDGRPSVSDFGIAHVPEASELRMTGNRLGPFGFSPDELIEDPQNADPFPVDVFQLAKTLLVLVSGAPYPPQGHIAAGTSGALSRYVADIRTEDLDQIIDRCTGRDPAARPTMAELARELETWLNYTVPADDPDLAELIGQFRARHRDTLDARQLHDQWARRVSEIVRRLETTTLQWVEDRFREAGLNPGIRSYHEHHEWLERMQAMGIQPTLVKDQRWVTGEIGDPTWPTKAAVGIGVDVDVQGRFWCIAHAAWGDMESTATRQWTGRAKRPRRRSRASRSTRSFRRSTLT